MRFLCFLRKLAAEEQGILLQSQYIGYKHGVISVQQRK